jgi:hypothetical protein
MAHLHTETRSEYHSHIDQPGGYTVIETDRYVVLDSETEKKQFIASLHKRLVAISEHIRQLQDEYDLENAGAREEHNQKLRAHRVAQRAYAHLPWYKRLFTAAPIKPAELEEQVVTTKLYDMLKSLPQKVELLYNPIPEELYLEVIKGTL